MKKQFLLQLKKNIYGMPPWPLSSTGFLMSKRRVFSGEYELKLLLGGFKIEEIGDAVMEKIPQDCHLEKSFL